MRELTDAERAEARKPFFPVTGDAAQLNAANVIRESFASLAEHLTASIRHSRNRSRALTSLEEACDCAIKAVYHDGLA